MLSLALAMEKLLGPMEPPSLVAGCAGCTVNTSAVDVGAACSCMLHSIKWVCRLRMHVALC